MECWDLVHNINGQAALREVLLLPLLRVTQAPVGWAREVWYGELSVAPHRMSLRGDCVSYSV